MLENLITTMALNTKIKPLTPIARKKNFLLFMVNFSRLIISWYFTHELLFNAKQVEISSTSTLKLFQEVKTLMLVAHSQRFKSSLGNHAYSYKGTLW